MQGNKNILNERWRNILHLLYNRTWISIMDINALFISNIKYCRRVMNVFLKNHWVKQIRCPIFNQKGPGINFYALQKNGSKKIYSNKRFKEPKTPTSVNLLHYYIINIFLTGFKVLSKQYPELKVESITEKQLKEHNDFFSYFYDTSSSMQFAIPDFVLTIGDGVNKLLFIGEVDACTETISNNFSRAKTIENKFKSISAYRENKIYNFFNKCFNYEFPDFTYLHITTGNAQRLEHLVSVCKCIGNLDDVLITTAEQIYPEKIINNKGNVSFSYNKLVSPVWIRVGDNDINTKHLLLE